MPNTIRLSESESVIEGLRKPTTDPHYENHIARACLLIRHLNIQKKVGDEALLACRKLANAYNVGESESIEWDALDDAASSAMSALALHENKDEEQIRAKYWWKQAQEDAQ